MKESMMYKYELVEKEGYHVPPRSNNNCWQPERTSINEALSCSV